jgi:peptidoglycan hydrolase-like protein with peptidoglycan-binding domain
MTAPEAAAVARRLQSLGHLTPPLPGRYEGRFQESVKAFQGSVGLPQDGILGPRTTLALSRVIAGQFGPATVQEVMRSR